MTASKRDIKTMKHILGYNKKQSVGIKYHCIYKCNSIVYFGKKLYDIMN